MIILLITVKDGKNLVFMNFSKQNKGQRKSKTMKEKWKERKEGEGPGQGHHHHHVHSLSHHQGHIQGHGQGHILDHLYQDEGQGHILHHHPEPGGEEADQGKKTFCVLFKFIITKFSDMFPDKTQSIL